MREKKVVLEAMRVRDHEGKHFVSHEFFRKFTSEYEPCITKLQGFKLVYFGVLCLI